MWAVFADDQFVNQWPTSEEAEDHATDLLVHGKAFRVVIYTPEAEFLLDGSENVVRH